MSPEQHAQRTNPFVGPTPLQEGDPIFGRDHELFELRNLLVAERIVLLYSPSGAGKTSLIRAGLIGKLWEAEFHVLPVISLSQPPTNGANGGNRYLLSTLRSLDDEVPLAAQHALGELEQLSLHDYLEARPRDADAPATDLLIFDQFEQILTLDPTDQETKEEFFAQVGETLRVGGRWALFSLREDHIAGLDPYRRWIPRRLAKSFRLEFLSPRAAREAIRGTAQRGGVDLSEDAAEQLVRDLSRVRVQRHDGTVGEEVGQEVEPVQLQVVCRRLWNHLPDDAQRIGPELVREYGDVTAALGAFYAELVGQVAETTGVPERDIRAWFDEHLITKQGVRGQVLQEAGVSAGLDDRAIRALIDGHLVRAESRRGLVWFELSHDRLIAPIQASNESWYQVHLNAFQQQARLWQSQGRVPGYLLTDEALAQAQQWAAANQERLTATEREYLDESLQHQRTQDAERQLLEEARARQRAEEAARLEAEQRVAEQALATQELRRRLVIARALAALALLLLIAAGIGLYLAFVNAQIAKVNSLRTLANLAISEQQRGDSELGALLARQAYLDRSDLILPATIPEVDLALGGLLGAKHFSHVFRGHQGSVLGISFDETGDRLASAGDDGTIRLWDLRNPATSGTVLEAAHRSGADVVAFQPGGPLVASGGDDRQVLLQHPGPDHATLALDHKKAVRTIAFVPDRHLLATAGREGCLRLWDLKRINVPTCTLPPDTAQDTAIRDLVLRPGHSQLFSGDIEGKIYVWDLGDADAASGRPHAALFASHMEGTPVWALAFSPEGDLLASVGEDGTIRLWDPDLPGSAPTILGTSLGFLRSVAFSPDGSRLASGGDDGIVRIWDVKTPLVPRENLQGHHGAVNAVTYDRENRWLASAGADGVIRVWELNDPMAFSPAGEPVTAMAIGPEGMSIGTSVGGAGHVQIRDLTQPGAPPLEVTAEGGAITVMAFDAKRERLATGGINSRVRIWGLTRSPPTSTDLDPPHLGRVTDLAFSPDGRWLVSSGVDEFVRVWDTSQPDRVAAEARGDPQGVNTVVFHPDGRWLAAAGSEGEIAIWSDLANPALPRASTFTAHEGRTIDMAIDPQGRWLASAGYDGTIKLWRLDEIPDDPDDPDPTPEHLLGPREGGINSIAFNRDGSTLASAGNDGSIWLWNLDHPAREPRLLIGNKFRPIGSELVVTAIAYSASADLLVRSGDVVYLWSTSVDHLAEVVCDRVWRNLTNDEWARYIGDGANTPICPNLSVEGERPN